MRHTNLIGELDASTRGAFEEHDREFAAEPLVGDYVYRYDPCAGHLSVVADSFNKPNGLAFSPDGGTLYVTDSGASQDPGSYHVWLPHLPGAVNFTFGGSTWNVLFITADTAVWAAVLAAKGA